MREIELKQEGCDIAGGFVFFQTGLGRSSLKRSMSKEKFITCGSISLEKEEPVRLFD